MRPLPFAVPALLAALAALAGCGSAPSDRMASGPAVSVSAVPASALNPDVRQDNIQQTICLPGWGEKLRPSAVFTNGAKIKLLQAQGTPPAEASFYDLDHRVPLSLGGHPTSLSNLAVHASSVAQRKVQVERMLLVMVCAGKVSLDSARERIYVDWPAAYRDLVEKR